uniref:Delta like non-canonical Notch ligand 2 n=1 Tax=Sander lucioperca TaxID=283035 RepID=A0A8C9XAA9_SANLU
PKDCMVLLVIIIKLLSYESEVTCDPGWDGELCDRCVLMPGCVHGSCRQPWQCRCETGWAGRFCDRVCSRRPCQNGATCVMEDGGEYACLCPHGFHGNNCQLKAGPCLQERSPCKNGGLCEDADGFAAALTCRCLAGFTGARCETDVDDCLMKPCANGATCLDAINRFLCVCPAGFTGRFCTVNVDDCASRPCLHAGRCLDRAGGFHCVCRPGYAGTTCEMPLRGWTNGGNSSGKNSSGENSGRPSDRLLRVTVSERGAGSGGGLSRLQLTVLLVLAGVTLGVVALTAGVVLQRYCRLEQEVVCFSQSATGVNMQMRCDIMNIYFYDLAPVTLRA